MMVTGLWMVDLMILFTAMATGTMIPVPLNFLGYLLRNLYGIRTTRPF